MGKSLFWCITKYYRTAKMCILFILTVLCSWLSSSLFMWVPGLGLCSKPFTHWAILLAPKSALGLSFGDLFFSDKFEKPFLDSWEERVNVLTCEFLKSYPSSLICLEVLRESLFSQPRHEVYLKLKAGWPWRWEIKLSLLVHFVSGVIEEIIWRCCQVDITIPKCRH